MDHAEEALVQIALHVHLKGQIVILEAPADAVEGLLVIEAHAIFENRAAQQTIMRAGYQVAGFKLAAVNGIEIGAGVVAQRRLAAMSGANTAEARSAVFHVPQ